MQVAGITLLLELEPVETRLCGSPVAGLNQVAGDVDSNNVSPQVGVERP